MIFIAIRDNYSKTFLISKEEELTSVTFVIISQFYQFQGNCCDKYKELHNFFCEFKFCNYTFCKLIYI